MTDFCAGVPNDTNRSKCEEQIFTAINDFNNVFKKYETAYNTYTKSDSTSGSVALLNDYNAISTKLTELKSYIDNYTTKYLTTTTGKVDSKKFHEEIMDKYNAMVESRKIMDEKLYELYVNEYDSIYSAKPVVDSTIVTGVLWTLIVTFMLYYVIVKM